MAKGWFDEFLEKIPMLEEERKMWKDAGFYVSLPSTNFCRLTTANIHSTNIIEEVGNDLRRRVIQRWEQMNQSSRDVRIVEVDAVRESLEARNESA